MHASTTPTHCGSCIANSLSKEEQVRVGRLRQEGVAQQDRVMQHFWTIIREDYSDYLRNNYPGLSETDKKHMRVEFEMYYGAARFRSSGPGEIGGAPQNKHVAFAKRNAKVTMVRSCVYVCVCV